MIRFAILVALVGFSPCSSAATGGKGRASFGVAPASAPGPTVSGRGGGSGRALYRDPRRAPPLDPDRRVSEQDCTKPLDLSAGNIKCK
jgi:hypothetical protein